MISYMEGAQNRKNSEVFLEPEGSWGLKNAKGIRGWSWKTPRHLQSKKEVIS